MKDKTKVAMEQARRAITEIKTLKTKIMISIPNMLFENVHLTRQIYEWLGNKSLREQGYEFYLDWVTEARFHDYARNVAAKRFMGSDAEWHLQIDSDTKPHPKLPELARRGKPLVSGTVFCYVKEQLLPSIWVHAPCEQCENMQDHREGKAPRDATQYKVENGNLLRWNPFRTEFEEFTECRCKGTGKDPWVFRVHPGAYNPQEPFFQADSVGAAALMVHRSVYEKLSEPWYTFLFRPHREILLTEDHYFCWKAKEAGFEIWADNQMPSNHFKTMDLLAVNQLTVKAYNFGKSEEDRRIVVPKIELAR